MSQKFKEAGANGLMKKIWELIFHIGFPIASAELVELLVHPYIENKLLLYLIMIATTIIALIASVFILLPIIYLIDNYQLLKMVRFLNSKKYCVLTNEKANEEYLELLQNPSKDSYFLLIDKIKKEQKYNDLLLLNAWKLKYDYLSAEFNDIYWNTNLLETETLNFSMQYHRKTKKLITTYTTFLNATFEGQQQDIKNHYGTVCIVFNANTTQIEEHNFYTDGSYGLYGSIFMQEEFNLQNKI